MEILDKSLGFINGIDEIMWSYTTGSKFIMRSACILANVRMEIMVVTMDRSPFIWLRVCRASFREQMLHQR